MKRLLAFICMMFMLSGCTNRGNELDRAMILREQLSKSAGYSFTAFICADYGEKVYTFAMECSGDANGNLIFSVTEPASISGVTGKFTQGAAELTFDDHALAFEVLADGQITPVSAPWFMMKALTGGYLKSCGEDGEGLYLEIDDSYAEDAVHTQIWTDSQDIPIRADILWQGRRILSMEVKDFTIL